MEGTPLEIGGVPAILWGPPSRRVWLCLHGQGGSRVDAAAFAEAAAASGAQALSLDLPEHGLRAERRDGACVPWQAVPEIQQAAAWARERWSWLGFRGESLGAWFGLLALSDCRSGPPDQALLVSPVLDMSALIEDMMGWAGVSEARLEREGEIPTDFGQTLSWRYLCYARAHTISAWSCPTELLYAAGDTLIRRETAEAFAARFGAGLTVADGEHWFHTPAQLETLDAWTRRHLGLYEEKEGTGL